MTTGIDTDVLLALLGVVFLLARGYGAMIADYQREFAEALFTWFGTPSERKPIYNFAIGIAIALLLTTVVAVYIREWEIIFVALVAGFFASTDAAKQHDAEAAADDAYDAGRHDERQLLVQRRRVTTPGPREG
jgi:hypothetical protein